MSSEGQPSYDEQAYQQEQFQQNDQQQQPIDGQWADQAETEQLHDAEHQINENDMENEPQKVDLNQIFYLRFYSGHKTEYFGTEFLEIELLGDGTLRYANESGYKKETRIRKQVKLSEPFFDWIRSRVVDSNLINASDEHWPDENLAGRQELELIIDKVHVFFLTCKFGSKSELAQYTTQDPSLQVFYNLMNDLKLWCFDIIGLHFRLSEL